MAVWVGTSGWSYDDWEGPVYPRGTPAGERLQHYMVRFPSVEIDSTYYRDPAPSVVRGWVEKTREAQRFEFSVKAPKTLTHEALVDAPLDAVTRIAQAWRILVADPLAEAGRLGAILLQLSPAILRKTSSLERIHAALTALAPHRVAVEFRNKTWHDDTPALDSETIALLDSHNAASVIVDGPSFPPIVGGQADHAFARFHGRNAARWHKKETYYGERYDYQYSEAELDPWTKRLAQLAREKKDFRIFFNNHVEGKAYRNAEAFETMLEREGARVVRASGPQRRLF